MVMIPGAKADLINAVAHEMQLCVYIVQAAAV